MLHFRTYMLCYGTSLYMNSVMYTILHLIRKQFDFIYDGINRSTSFSSTSEWNNTIGTHVVTTSHYRPRNEIQIIPEATLCKRTIFHYPICEQYSALLTSIGKMNFSQSCFILYVFFKQYFIICLVTYNELTYIQ